MKKRLCFLLSLAVILALLPVVTAGAAVDLSSPAYVVDDANVLSDALEEQIIQTNQMLEYDCQGAQLVVVTTAYPAAGMDREEYAKEIFDTWNIGSAEADNGTLLVIYTGTDDFWLECGYGIYNSPYVDEIAAMVEDSGSFCKALDKGQYENAVSSLLSDLRDWYGEYYGTGTSSAPAPGGSVPPVTITQTPTRSSNFGLKLLLLVIVLLILTSPFRVRRTWGHWGMWPFFYFSSWWPTRVRVRRPARPYTTYTRPPPPPMGGFSTSRPPATYHRTPSAPRPSSSRPSSSRPSSGFGSRPSGGSFHSGGGHSGGGFGSRSSGGSFRSGGGSFRGGGGHSGGGFGKR